MKHSLNYLLKVQAVCELYQDWKAKGYTNRWIWANKVKPLYFISENTMYTYLRTPYKRMLKELGYGLYAE